MRALIVDDEKPARERLIRLLQVYDDIEIVGEASHGQEALIQADKLLPDVVFLDIEMPELTGIETASALGSEGPAIVFVTAYDEYALKAFDSHAADYLLKPVAKERLEVTIQKLRTWRRPNTSVSLNAILQQFCADRKSKRLAVKTGQRYVVFDLDQVSAVVARDHYSEIIFGQQTILADDSLDVLERRLDPHRFFRIHRSSIVNIDFLREMRREGDRKYTALLSNYFESEFPISREKIELLKVRLGL